MESYIPDISYPRDLESGRGVVDDPWMYAARS